MVKAPRRTSAGTGAARAPARLHREGDAEAFEAALVARRRLARKLDGPERDRRDARDDARRRSRVTPISRARRSRTTSTVSRRRGSCAGVLDPDDRRVRRLELTPAGAELHATDDGGRDRAPDGDHGRARRERRRRRCARCLDVIQANLAASGAPAPRRGESARARGSRSRRASAGRAAPSGRRSTRGRARASRPSTSRSRAAPARTRSGRAGRRAAASRPAGRSASSAKNRARIGRGPTNDMSPRSTFQSCGISSSCDAFSQRPIRVYSASVRRTSSSPRYGPEPRLGVALERAELQHREEVRAAPDALAAVEDRAAAREQDREGDQAADRQEEQPEERREAGRRGAELDVDPAAGRLGGEPPVPADEGVLELCRDHRTDGRAWAMTVLGIDHVQVAAPPGGEDEARAFYGGAARDGGAAEARGDPRPRRLLVPGRRARSSTSASRSRSRRRARRTPASSSPISTRSARASPRPGRPVRGRREDRGRRPALRPRPVREPAGAAAERQV